MVLYEYIFPTTLQQLIKFLEQITRSIYEAAVTLILT